MKEHLTQQKSLEASYFLTFRFWFREFREKNDFLELKLTERQAFFILI
ncbi:MAG: hypothetical protein IPN61_00950 [Bacteroidetes bacterium]|nr:hypothetical protein [Bacteroidota bacterium]